jgi:hypothetical protein
MLRLELLKVKADLERELETWVPNCTRCGLDVHWVSGLGSLPVIGRTESRRRTASPSSARGFARARAFATRPRSFALDRTAEGFTVWPGRV